MGFDLSAYLAERKASIEEALEGRLPSTDEEPCRIHEAMRHATLGGGKRIRPILVLEVAQVAGRPVDSVMDTACALELIHTASLVLDDLPSMDNAASRRSRPCTHAAFGEATAILCSLALIGKGFELVARNAEGLDAGERSARAVRQLAEAIGPAGIIHGQHADLGLVDSTASLETLERVYGQKAGALFVASVSVPAALLGLPAAETQALETYACEMGLAFQIIDDLLDAHRKPEDRGKTTFATHLGLDGARVKADELLRAAARRLDGFSERAEALRQLAEYVRTRTT